LWAIIRRLGTPSGSPLYAVAGVSEHKGGFPAGDERRQGMLALSVGIPIVIIAILVFLVIVIFAIRRRRYLSRSSGPTWRGARFRTPPEPSSLVLG